LGTFVLSAGYYDAYYAKAQKVRSLIKQDFENAFKDVDVILTPVTPTLPFKIGEKTDDPLQMYLSDIFTIPLNLAGLPGISIPVKGRGDKLPVGFQLIGKPWHEADILGLGSYYEKK
jgi:aspartyl-tRNA(Asn)/glutamyl-tRNA(Gln) amidotransferase subunit A